MVGSADYGWLGSHSRPAEDGATIIQMGARPYLPAIGRFLSVDPVEAGTPNDYAYPADPVNEGDLTGLAVSILRRQSAAWGQTQPDAIAKVQEQLQFIQNCAALGAGSCWTHLGTAQRNSVVLRFNDGLPSASDRLSGNSVATTPIYYVDLQVQTASHYEVADCWGWGPACVKMGKFDRYDVIESETVLRLSFESRQQAESVFSLFSLFWI